MLALHAIAAVLLLALALYAQRRLPDFTARRGNAMLLRLVLLVVGLLAGYVAASGPGEEPLRVLSFIHGFGLVHLPAAIILFLKRARGEGPS